MADYERVPGGKRLPTSLNSEEERKVNVIIFSHFDFLERETWFYFFSHFLVPYRLLCIFIFVFRYKLAVADYERVPGCGLLPTSLNSEGGPRINILFFRIFDFLHVYCTIYCFYFVYDHNFGSCYWITYLCCGLRRQGPGGSSLTTI